MLLIVVPFDCTALQREGVATRTNKQGFAELIAAGKKNPINKVAGAVEKRVH
jgi:hypothetical protein